MTYTVTSENGYSQTYMMICSKSLDQVRYTATVQLLYDVLYLHRGVFQAPSPEPGVGGNIEQCDLWLINIKMGRKYEKEIVRSGKMGRERKKSMQKGKIVREEQVVAQRERLNIFLYRLLHVKVQYTYIYYVFVV